MDICIFFYIFPYYRSKHQIFDEVHNLFATIHDLWLILGDFNDIILSYENLNGQPVYFNDNNCLIDYMHSTLTVYLGSIRYQNTWCNKRNWINCIHKRLDRAVITANWIHDFPIALVSNIPFILLITLIY